MNRSRGFDHVVLVGNSRVQTGLPVLEEKSFIIRFNVPRHQIAETGVKCDALCVTNHGNPGRRMAKFKRLRNNPFVTTSTEIWFPRPRAKSSWTCLVNHPFRGTRWTLDHSWHIARRNGFQDHTLVFLSKENWLKAFDLLGLDKGQSEVSPSTGFLALTYALDRFAREHEIHVLGFTFEGSNAHPWALERAAVEKMDAEGKVRLHKRGVPERPLRHDVQAA
jgi:hypothetical protein